MGLLSSLFGGGSNAGGGFFGSGAKQTETTTIYDTDTNTYQTDQSGAGLALNNVGRFSSDSHDYTELNNRETTIYQAIDGGALKTAGDVIAGGLDLAQRSTAGAIGAVERISGNSLDLFAELAAGSIDSARQLARDSMDANANATRSAVEGFAALSKQTSASSDDRVTKIAGFALAAIVAALVVPALFKGKGKAVIA